MLRICARVGRMFMFEEFSLSRNINSKVISHDYITVLDSNRLTACDNDNIPDSPGFIAAFKLFMKRPQEMCT